MNWPRLLHRLLAQHPGELQVCAELRNAVKTAEDGLAVLARHGHCFHLMPGAEPDTTPWAPEWPKVLFHAKIAPAGRTCHGPEWLAEWGPGWAETLEDAQRIEGTATQFAGRGGVKRRDLPAVVASASASASSYDLTDINAIKEAFLKQQRESKGAAR